MRSRSNNAGDSFVSTLTINNAIALPSPGRYRMTLQTFIHCANILCDTGDDAILIKIKENGASDFDKTIFKVGIENERIRDRRWNMEEFYFETTTDKITVREKNYFNYLVFYNFLFSAKI